METHVVLLHHHLKDVRVFQDQVVGLGRIVLDVEELEVDETSLVHQELPLV